MMQPRFAWVALFAALLMAPRDAPAPIKVTPEGQAPPAVERPQIASLRLEPATVELVDGEAAVRVRVRALTARGGDVLDYGGEVVSVYRDGQLVPPERVTVSAPPEGGPGFVVGFRAPADGDDHEIRVELAGRAAALTATFPASGGLAWLYVGGAAALVGLAGLPLALRRRRPRGQLSFMSGPAAGSSVGLRRGITRIGSLERNEVVLESTSVSRYHAEITVQGDKAEIRDLHSTNGTYVNGHPVELALLSPGDKIQIGDFQLFFDR